MYQNSKIILATKHKKEEAIQQPFEDAFKAKIFVQTDFDTDQFGTFTGDIPRENSAFDTVIKKAHYAAATYGFDYAIASEGSFGPHPTIFFAPADSELLAFVDTVNAISVVESEITTETNFAHQDITANENYTDFLEKINFGTHGVILRSLHNNTVIAKGITQFDELNSILKIAFNDTPIVRLETDMRAMMNPTRMRIINKLAIKLTKRLQKLCARCSAPGFGETSVSGKLLCESCGTETALHQFKVLGCVRCDYQEFFPRADGRQYADPQYCPYCNP